MRNASLNWTAHRRLSEQVSELVANVLPAACEKERIITFAHFLRWINSKRAPLVYAVFIAMRVLGTQSSAK